MLVDSGYFPSAPYMRIFAGGHTILYPPLFHLLLGNLFLICGLSDAPHIVFVLKLWTALLNGFFVLPVFLLGRKMLDGLSGLASAALVSTSFLKFEMMCWGLQPYLIGLLLMGLATYSLIHIRRSIVSLILFVGVLLSNPYISVLCLVSLLAWGLIFLIGNRRRSVFPRLMICFGLAALFFGMAIITGRPFWLSFLAGILNPGKVFPYNWWDLSWRIQDIVLILLPLGLAQSLRKHYELPLCLLVWVAIGFIGYYGRFLGVYFEYFRVLQYAIIPLIVFAGVGLRYLLIRKEVHPVGMCILVFFILIDVVFFAFFAANCAAWYRLHNYHNF
jgi:hypothetical protein